MDAANLLKPALARQTVANHAKLADTECSMIQWLPSVIQPALHAGGNCNALGPLLSTSTGSTLRRLLGANAERAVGAV